MKAEVRDTDAVVHPKAVEREKKAVEEERAKDLRHVTGWLGIGMSIAGFLAGLMMIAYERGPVTLGVIVLAGSFVGALVSGNVIPYSRLMDFALRLRGDKSGES